MTGEEFLQVLFWQAMTLENTGARVTVTYAYYNTRRILVPTTFDYLEGAKDTNATKLQSDSGINSFSKHCLLARILNKRARVTIAGKLYIKVAPINLAATRWVGPATGINWRVQGSAAALER